MYKWNKIISEGTEMTPNKGSVGWSKNVNKWKNGDANLFVTTVANKTVSF